MASRTIALLLGILIFQHQPRFPSLGAFVWLSALGIAALALNRAWPRSPLHKTVIMLLFVGVGFTWAACRAGLLLADSLPQELEGRDLTVHGVIQGLPQGKGRGTQFVLVPESVYDGGRPIAYRGRMRITWYDHPPALAGGDRWRLTVRLKRPHGMVNPGGFDYEGSLFQKGITATGYVRKGGVNRLLAAHAGFPIDQMRDLLRRRMERALGDTPHAGILVALAIGEKSGITREEWELFRDTGTTHLMAISGLHVGMVAALAAWLGRRAWRSPRLMLAWPAQKAAAVAGFAAAALYALLAGFSVPTQRTLVMIGAVVAALLRGRNTRPHRLLAIACLAVLIYDPLAVLAPGFWLSFGAVALILYSMGGRLQMRGMWWRFGRMQWMLALGLAPLLIAFFGGAPLASPVANLIAVPWISLLVVPPTLIGSGLLLISPAVGEILLRSAGWLLHLLWPLLEGVGQWIPVWSQAQPPPWVVVCAIGGILLLLAPRGTPGRWLGAAWCIPLIWWVPERPQAGEIWLTLLDVGQGLSVVVETGKRVVVFDTGPKWGPDFDTGRAVVVPFLRYRGWPRIDTLVLSHADNDHAGGARSLAAAVPPDRILTAAPERIPWQTSEACRRGMGWEWDGVRFELLHPQRGTKQQERENDDSCVLRVVGTGGAVLLAGDIEATAERSLLQRGDDLSARVLVVPHHGSRSSSTRAFLSAVRPELALFSLGYRNRYRFPSAAVVARYEALNVTRFETARHGAVMVKLTADGRLESQTWREISRRYWYAD